MSLQYSRSAKGRMQALIWRQTDRGRESKRLQLLRYRQTDKGIAFLRRRYERLGSNAGWRDKANFWIFVEGRPCCLCNETDKEKLQCDHIVSRAKWFLLHGSLAGCDDDSNLRILCLRCHGRKTKEDIRELRLCPLKISNLS